MKIRLTRSAAMAVAIAALVGGTALGAVTPAFAAPSATVMITTQRMSGPALNTTQNGTYGKGASLALSCFEYGQSVKGYYSPWLPNGGWDNIWYRVSDGYWVADVDINTGSNSPVTGRCSDNGGGGGAASSGLSAKVDSFVNQYKGRRVDFDGYYGAQCVDLFNFYNRDIVGAGRIGASYAYQLYNNAPASKYEKLGAGVTPRKGDVAIWNSSKPGSGGAGHVAIVLSDVGGGNISVLEQNVWLSKSNPNSETIVRNESKSYLIGYLRPRV